MATSMDYIKLFNRVGYKEEGVVCGEEDFVAIGLYQKMTDEESLRLIFSLLSKKDFIDSKGSSE